MGTVPSEDAGGVAGPVPATKLHHKPYRSCPAGPHRIGPKPPAPRILINPPVNVHIWISWARIPPGWPRCLAGPAGRDGSVHARHRGIWLGYDLTCWTMTGSARSHPVLVSEGWAPAPLCKGKSQYLLTCKVSRYCILPLHGGASGLDPLQDRPSCPADRAHSITLPTISVIRGFYSHFRYTYLIRSQGIDPRSVSSISPRIWR